MAAQEDAGGLLRSLRRLADTGLETVQVRLSLLGTELEQEKQRLFDALARAALGLLLAGVTLVLAVAFVVLLLQEGYRLAALGVLTLVFGAAAVWLLRSARTVLHSGAAGPFALSLAELRRDRARVDPARTPDPAP